ncbi:sigma-B regulation protein RsbU (phosphoserine phosphatase) [Melghiribacillus thermohalophilus]|uniref:Sigma-B regulation protein RsbU (Phosphoserine phosphatase) n=1 Tax=Melghiribacillus thermohalophilus TaxID=1324956 RepID=A0A4R3MV49_9BACI|nr:PP2C family protein-serine/threonine phosphatase [Melghiribacillus thermohalophilus]TCT20390.1 sigma-B regulation protein RsbU (phosphoserine phosphatase) [Melghiribacillus thermohalophilus]
MQTVNLEKENYKQLLKRFIEKNDEETLYKADLFSKESIRQNVTPDEIIHVYIQALEDLYPDLPETFRRSLDFLLETMISYGVAYKEFQEMREEQLEIKSELALAAKMQEKLLNTRVPEIKGLDIGAISIPAKQMNGDYYHFIEDHRGNLGVAIADVIGKGFPAALCMSMVKYTMDSFPESRMLPKRILQLLNRVVEKNVDPGMFVTMFYGLYNPDSHDFYYASAGHEPGLFYHGQHGVFTEIEAKGLVLGVERDVTYKQYKRRIELGDMIVLLTDGVTECRRGERFLERDEVIEVMKQYTHLPAQQMVERVFRYFEELQDFQLRDDFTLIVIRREN